MAINLKFDLIGNPEPPSIVLANRNGNKLGQLNVNVESIDVSDKFNAASELSFTLNKYIDGKPTPLWDKVVDFKLVYCPEWDMWFEIKVELDETTETVKTVFCTQLGRAELSQIKVYNIHINEEGDPNWDTNNEIYKSTILYDPQNTDASLLHRLLKDKAPHYSIAYVDESIQRIQRQFSFDDTSICDAFDEISEEIGCLFVYNSNSTKGGKPNRTISVYDLQQKCKDCGHRGEFTDKCPKCGSTDITYGYGEDTTIFVSNIELATEGIQLVTDTDSVKNCFKLEGGDDLMTATIRNCNPNGSDYIWYFSDGLKEDMSKELVERIESYDKKYQDYYNNHISELDENLVNKYNNLVEVFDENNNLVGGYSRFYNTKSTCLNCGHEEYFEEQCPICNSKNILTGQKLQIIPTTIKGYPDLMTAYYNTIDLLLYLESGLMPNIKMSDTTAEEQLRLLTTSSLSPVAVNVKDIDNTSLATADSAVLSMAKVLIKSTYKVEIKEDSSSLSGVLVDSNGEYRTWIGKFKVTNYSDEKDTAVHSDNEVAISVRINNDTKTFIKQKIDKALNKENTDDYSITGLFANEYNDFCAELKKYALNPLDNFSKACDACLSILHEQGVGDNGNGEDDETEKARKEVLYNELYKPYFDKQQAINREMEIRENEIAIIEGIWDKSDENNPKCTTDGLQQCIERCQKEIQEMLDFEKHLGEDLWLEFCAYRREDKYSNDNYISDGLNNAELFEKANEFIEVAEEEIFKSAELQHSISATLNNLLSLPKFKPLLKFFKTGNWIRVQVDDKVYKLRLLEYGFGYGDFESILVEFSDVTKIKNGTTDVKDILSQASSMASSYNSVQRQAKKGDVARSAVDQWIVDGLNAANVQIQSNDSEEVLLTKNGLLARSYDDITGTYSPEQLKITHNIMAYTDDNWKTVRQAIGKQDHKIYEKDKESFVDKTGYGMNADFVNAGVVSGSQIIGGDIYSENYIGSTDEETGKIISSQGSYIDLKDGKFSFAGGKLAYDGSDLTIVGKIEVTTSGRIGCWDINETSIFTGSSNYYDANGMYFGEQGLSLGNQFKVEPNGIATMTNANVSGTITGSQIIGRNSIFVGKADKNDDGYYVKDYNEDYAEITENGKLTCTNIDILGGTLKIGRYEARYEDGTPQLDEDGNQLYGWNTWIDETGILKANEAVVSGVIYAGAGSIGGFTIEPVKDENGDVIGGWLYSSDKMLGDNESIFLSAIDMEGTVNSYTKDNWRMTVGSNFGVINDGTVYAYEAILDDCTITGGSLKMGNADDGYSAWISVDEGVLNANGVNISGTINAVNGDIGGWYINETGICSDNSVVGLSSSSVSVKSLVSSGKSPIRVYAGAPKEEIGIEQVYSILIDGRYKTRVTIEKVKTNGKIISAEIKSMSLDKNLFLIKNVDVVSDNEIEINLGTGYSDYISDAGIPIDIEIEYVYIYDINISNMMILEDGSFYANAANINGKITATSGNIGGWEIVNGLVYNDDTFYDLHYYDEESGLGTGFQPPNSGDYAISVGFSDYHDWSTGYFLVKHDGSMYATKGKIGGWEITTHGIQNTNLNGLTSGFEVQFTGNDGNPTVNALAIGSTDANNWSDAPFRVTHEGKLYAVNATMSQSLSLTTDEGFDILFDHGGIHIKYDDAIFGGIEWRTYLDSYDLDIWAPSISIGVHNTESATHHNYLHGTWHVQQSSESSSSIVTSDANKKNSVEPLDVRYDTFFDNLITRRFKYNEGTSDRYHSGYVAQEVQSALKTANISEREFAGVCTIEAEDEKYNGLRYDEFISLNTWQIQKLKSRVLELENKLKSLEQTLE